MTFGIMMNQTDYRIFFLAPYQEQIAVTFKTSLGASIALGAGRVP